MEKLLSEENLGINFSEDEYLTNDMTIKLKINNIQEEIEKMRKEVSLGIKQTRNLTSDCFNEEHDMINNCNISFNDTIKRIAELDRSLKKFQINTSSILATLNNETEKLEHEKIKMFEQRENLDTRIKRAENIVGIKQIPSGPF